MNCVYRIYSTNPAITECYIGSTKNLKTRVAVHKNCFLKTATRVSQYIGQHGFENFIFEPLEEMDTYDRKKLAEREAHYFNLFKPTLNMNVPNRSHEQYCLDNPDVKSSNARLYHQKHREKYKANARERYLRNKEQMKQRAREYYHKNKASIVAKRHALYLCCCGGMTSKAGLKEHLNSKGHQRELKLAVVLAKGRAVKTTKAKEMENRIPKVKTTARKVKEK